MLREEETDCEKHVLAEGIEYFEPEEYHRKAYRIAGEMKLDPLKHESFGQESVTLYRGDTVPVFEDMNKEDRLERGFPIYLADTPESATGYTEHKLGDGERILLEVDVPYDDIEIFTGNTMDVESGDAELDQGKIYFLGSNLAQEGGEEHLEFAATEIPKDWVSVSRID